MNLSNPFTDLQTALTNSTGLDYTLSGIVLGLILTISLLIMLIFILDPRATGKGDSTILIAGGIGVVISTAVGWFPVWIVVFIAIIIIFIMIDPLSTRSKAGG